MSDRGQEYFGKDGCFSQACDLYCKKSLPAKIFAHAETLGESRIAYALGYAFATVLHERKMTISDDDLEYIAKGKIVSGQWPEFINGFRKFES